jgi:hypothetical protein
MSETVINAAAADSAVVNDLIAKGLKKTEAPEEVAQVDFPADNLVNLPGGYVLPSGEVIRVAEVRELTGRDEEMIAKNSNPGRIFPTMLSRAVVKIGEQKATEEILTDLLSGDRDALLVGIYKATFGNTAEIASWCEGCQDFKIVEIDVDKDIKSTVLVDPINDRVFTVKGKSHEYLVTLPTGMVQRDLLSKGELNYAETLTVILENSVLQIDGRQVLSKSQVQNLGLVDRKNIIEAITKRAPGPKFEPITLSCPDCESEVQVPISLGALFQL